MIKLNHGNEKRSLMQVIRFFIDGINIATPIAAILGISVTKFSITTKILVIFICLLLLYIYFTKKNLSSNMIRFLKDQDEVDDFLFKMAKDCSSYIYTTGYRSHNHKYLNEIVHKYKSENIEYIRIVNGFNLSDETKTHVKEILYTLKSKGYSKFKIYCISDEVYAKEYHNIVIIDDNILIFLPDPQPGNYCAVSFSIRDVNAYKTYYLNSLTKNFNTLINLTDLLYECKNNNLTKVSDIQRKWIEIFDLVDVMDKL